MTHTLILSGTQSGGVAPKELHLTRVVNQPTVGNLRLDYVSTDHIDLTRVVNTQSFGDLELEQVAVSLLHQTAVTNTNTFGSLLLAAVVFDPANDETETLIAAFDQSYPTTSKRQMDTLITELKDAGTWAQLDWYGNAYWALSEHDALLNWVNPAQTLVKVGTASWSLGVGLSGVNPSTSNSRYKSGWNVGAGPHSNSTSFAFFSKITAIAVPQNGMQPMGVWRLSSPGPAAPEGSFFTMSILAGGGSGGANVLPFNGNNSFAVGDGLGVWGVSRNGGTNITVKNGATLESDSVSGANTYFDADGMSVAGSAGGARQSFPGTQLYWGWGAALTAAQFGSLETAFQEALLPPDVSPPEDTTHTFITIPAGAVGADLTDFPLIINLADLKPSFQAELSTDAGNLRAYDASSALLYLDIIKWDGSAGSAAIKVPTIAAATDTVISLEIDASPTQPAVGSAGGRNGVWSDYEFTLFGLDASTFVDHAGKKTFAVSGTPADITSVTQTDGLFPGGKALNFTTAGSVSGGDGIFCSLSTNLRSFTFSASIMQTFTSTADNFGVASLYNNANNGQRKSMAWRGTDSFGSDSMQCWDSDNSWFAPSPLFIPVANTTKFRGTLTYSANTSGTRRQLWNGPDGKIGSASYSSHPVGDRFILGNNQPGGSEPGNCQVSFVYVRSGVLSDNWLRAEYKMLTNRSTIYTAEPPPI